MKKKQKDCLKNNHFVMFQLKKTKFKKLNNVDTLSKLPFYDKLNIIKTAKTLKTYAKSYSFEIIKDKDGSMNNLLVQLETSKPVIKNSFKYLLIEIKGSKYQITLKILLSKKKGNGDTEFGNVYFNSKTKTVIDINKYGLDKSFQDVSYRLYNWINEYITIEYIHGEYINISIYSPLLGSTYNELPDELKNSMKGLINIQNNICINVFCFENDLVYPVHISKQKFEEYIDLLLINDENKMHYVYIKDFNRFMSNKAKYKNKKHF